MHKEVAAYVLSKALECLEGKTFITLHKQDAEDVFAVLSTLGVKTELVVGINDYLVKVIEPNK